MSRVMLEAIESRLFMSAAAPVVTQTNLISDGPATAPITDAHVVNAWGLATGNVRGVVWMGNNGSGTSTLFDASANRNAGPVVQIPGAGGASGGPVTGVATNPGKGFVVTENGASAPAEYVFVTEDGTISGWNDGVDPSHAINFVDNSSSGAVYKGDAVAKVGPKDFLYVANFHANTVEVYDQNLKPVSMPFTDPNELPGYAPFNVASLNGKIYVTYALQDAAKHDHVAGAGNGFVDVFSTKGKFMQRLATGGDLNAPWGMAVAPASFGKFKGDLLVGNFGDGKINVLSNKGAIGQLADANGSPIAIDGLWGLDTGDGLKQDANRLYFASGPNAETHGLFGYLTAAVKSTPKSSGGGSFGGGFMY